MTKPDSLPELSLKTPVRLGAISFINTMPIYGGLPPVSGLELLYDVPARLNAAMAAGALDISPVSSAFYLRNQERFVLLNDLSVSSPGAVESVIFLSRAPLGPELLDTPRIAVPDDSETSVALLSALIQARLGQDLSEWFVTYPASQYRTALAETGSALIIGDNALLAQQELQRELQENTYHCYDLSTLWHTWTGLPFVFAVWVAERQWAEANPDTLVAVNGLLIDNRNRFFADPARFEEGVRAAASRCTITPEQISRYFSRCLTYRLDGEHSASLARFGQVLAEADHRAELAQSAL